MASPTKIRAQIAAHARWAKVRDREAATQPARNGRWLRYLERARELQGPEATLKAVEEAAEHLRQADMARMSMKAATARTAKAKARRGGGGDGQAA